MKAVIFKGVNDVKVESVPEPVIVEQSDAIVRVTTAAICGSDLHIYHGKIPGTLPGMTLGHEYVGIVEEVGPQVREVRKGDRVVGPFHVACGMCRSCRRGAYNQCERGGVLGYGIAFGNYAGSQAQFVRIPFADFNLRKIPKDVSDEKALFAGDILTTAYGAVRNSGLLPGETVAVIGAGPVGLMAVMSAFVLGASQVFSIDLVKERVEQAAALGAIPIPSKEMNAKAKINEVTGGQGVDVVIEAVGGTPTLKLAFELVRGGGRVSAVGITSEDKFEFPLMQSLVSDLTFRIGVANIHRDIDAVLALLQAGRIDPTTTVTHRLALEEAQEGYRLFDEKKAGKVLLKV
ncbi:MAG: alcohol dehydrogenase catalytic domain-containing protein [Candidatus Carbobacillus altaicus]|uniref:Threonine dehydrogenase n=1 Tax=Candidatus Carbonibacillus altaicus TaxID=2163959 RepID=A0A2R6Y112_9BACL|nr:alcohol dehydrogenase catalytic domain-containing protein [Candidatus Carbobacillus altaicus]PTQ56361.1 MAG: Threonine dehydrogenase [Candidatus Carbobacillus altaicus]